MAYNRFTVPTLMREPLPFNLLEAAVDVTPDDEHWQSGIAWQTDIAAAPSIWDPHAEIPADKTLTGNESVNDWDTAVLYYAYVCPVANSLDKEDIETAKDRLQVGSAHGVEELFWTWALSEATAIGVTGAANAVVAGLGQKLAESGLPTQGIVHMPPWAAEMYLSTSGFDASQGEQPLTNRGDIISVGAGYGSVGAFGTSQTVIATGPVGYMLSDIEIIESPDMITTDNRRIVLAERYVALQVDEDPIFSGVITIPS